MFNPLLVIIRIRVNSCLKLSGMGEKAPNTSQTCPLFSIGAIGILPK